MTLSCKYLRHHIWLSVLRVSALVLIVLQYWYYWITQPTDRFIACHELFLVQIPLCRLQHFSPTGKSCYEGRGHGSMSMKWDSFVRTPGRVWLFWHIRTFTFNSGDFLVRAEAIQGLQGEDKGESFINGSETWAALLDECMWFLYPEWECVPSSGLAG